MKGDNTKCYEVGCNDYLTKPVNRKELLDKVDKYLNSKGKIMTEAQNHNTPNNETPDDNCRVPDEAVFSWDKLLERFGDEETAVEVVSIFLKDGTERFGQLSSAIDTCDIKQIRFIAHSLKGAGGNIGSKAIWDICSKMEHAAVQGDFELAKSCYSELYPIFDELVEFLSRSDWLEQAKSAQIKSV